MLRSTRHVLFTSFVVAFASLWVQPVCGSVPLVLNELMASNNSVVEDPQGDYDDWIEIYNASDSPVDAGGLYLTDDPANPTRWRIPAGNAALTTVPARGFLLIWADGETSDSGLHAGFNLDADGDSLYLFDADGSTLIDSAAFGEQTSDVSYGRSPDGVGDWSRLTGPTPGAANAAMALGVVSDIEFSHERGFYETALQLAMTCDTPDATIYYTIDGSEPYVQTARSFTGTRYAGPIRIAKTTTVRAIAVKEGWTPSRLVAHSYLFLNHVAAQARQLTGFPATWGSVSADYEMDPDILSNPQYGEQLRTALLSLPTMSLAMDVDDLFGPQKGIYANSGAGGPAWEREGSVELIYPDSTEGFQINCGVRIQGGYFRSPTGCRKHSFRLLFKGEYGPTKLRYPLFGEDAAQEFDTIVLRAGANDGYTWSGNEANAQFARDQFVRELQLGTGNAASHGRFVHLYVNGLYWGLYNPCERPDSSFCSSYYGGDKDDWDVFKHKNFTVSQGNSTALNQMLAQCQEAGKSYGALMKLQGKGLDGQPRSDYPCLLDLADYVDYMIVNMWAGNYDWPSNNYWLGRDRTAASTGFKFYCWDSEYLMLSRSSPVTMDIVTYPDSTEVGQPHSRLRNSAEYKLFFADRIHRLFFNGGVLTTDSVIEHYTQLTDGIALAIIPEAARWADQHGSSVTPAHWASMRDRLLTSYLPQRSNIVLNQFRSAGFYPNVAAPVFYIGETHQHGGHMSATSQLAMDAGGAVYYTLDGSDPRLPSIEASGGEYATTLVPEDAAKRVLVPTGPVSDAWRGGQDFDDSAWISGAGGVGYERSTGYESLFHIDLIDSMYARQATCYIRIPFTLGQDPAKLSGVQLRVRYDDGFVAWINGVEVARRNLMAEPVWNSAAEASNLDIDAIELETISLPNAQDCLRTGQNILAIQGLNDGTTSSDFLLSATLVYGAAAPGTPSGVSANAVRYTGPVNLAQSACVKARALSGSTWSALNEAVYSVGPVAESLRISEIQYHPAGDPNAEYIELTNVGAESINLNLVRFAKGIQYAFSDYELAPGGYCLLAKDLVAFEAAYGDAAVLGQYTGSLDNAGERIELLDAAGTVIESFQYNDGWFDLTDGLGFSLTRRDFSADPDGKSAWRPSAQVGGSPGTDDGGQVPELGSVVINEIMANPAGGSDWIELYNTTDRAIDLSGWFLSDDANELTRYRIAEGTSLAAGGYLVFTQDQHFANADDPGCSEPFGLSKNGETVYLHSGSSGVLTGYSEQEKFDASEAGVSMGRWQKSTGSYNFVALRQPTPGAANAEPIVGPIVITEILYHPGSEISDLKSQISGAEYVEFLNISDAPVTLYDAEEGAPWRLTDDPDEPAIELLFPSDPPITLGPGQYLVIAKDLSLFNARYTVPAGVQVLAWGPGKLPDGNGKVQLSMPGEVDDDGERSWLRVDRISYSDGSHPQDFAAGVDPWPLEADGQGNSLIRIDSHAYGNDPANWAAAAPSPGRANP